MPEYLAPGVYVEETSFRPKTIEGVSTSTAGFVGPTRTGPTSGEPRLLTSFADFRRIYGGLEDLEFEEGEVRTNYLAYAVRAFFEEGGRRCYVARVFDPLPDDNDGGATRSKGGLTFSARYPGAAGNMVVRIRPLSSRDVSSGQKELPGMQPGDTVFAAPGEDTVFADLGEGVGFYDYVLDNNGNRALETKGKNQEEDEVVPKRTPISDLTAKDSVYPLRIRILVQRVKKRPSGGKEFGPEEALGEYNLNPTAAGSLIEALRDENPSGDPAMTPIVLSPPTNEDDNVIQTGYEYAEKIFSSPITKPLTVPITVDGIGSDVSHYKITFKTDGVKIPEDALSVKGTMTPASATVDFEESSGNPSVEVKIDGGSVQGTKGTLLNVGVAITDFSKASLEIDSFEKATSVGGNLETSDVVESVSVPSEYRASDLAEYKIRLQSGNDGKEPTSYETDTTGSTPPSEPEGFDALEDLENISIVAAPGYTAIGGKESDSSESERLNVQGELITHCEDMKYRIAVLATPGDYRVGEARDWRGNIDSTYAAMYYPWISIFDPKTRSELDVSPEGHVAGLYARNDIEDGVHKAPANMVVRSAVGFERRINKRQQDVLNPEGVNCFRFFEGRGNRLWGARMATSDNEYKYVNIRRYLAYLERSIDQGTQIFVFENNGADLWRNVRRTIGSFLKNEWRSNRLMGTTPEEAYFVKCDRSTMTQNDIDNGRLICEIGVALFRPAEFVIFRIGQKLLSDTG